ncbi:NACHT domain-containing protein [Shewanella vaxholmensis]|uniref:NACHT domain-containing protein n=1 Tax=Shewanella vaxholmensis TaxID=3063535 RepID=UPI0031882809
MVEQILFKKLIDSLWPTIKSKASLAKKLKNLNAANAYLSAANVEKVKTIWQVDKEVNLHNFYYPTQMQLEGKRIKIEGLNSFPDNGKIVIQGTAGQGKSILMRYITSIELKKASTLPIFVELRKISEKKSLIDLILDNLKEIGLNIDSTELDALFATNKCSLILDAFDEIPKSLVNDTITKIESICNQHYGLSIIISSRPNAEIQKSTFFRVINLAELSPNDFEPLLEKLFCSSNNNIADLLKAIHSSESQVVGVITTPLLLTLLVIIYKSFNEIPNNLSEFYDKLFTILCYRHDSTKPGFKREFATGLTESQLSKLFDSFCFCCMKAKISSLPQNEAISLTNEAIDLSNSHIENAELFLIDITKVTCLVVEEGFEYHFIHKSIREYHAAHYLKEHAQESLKIAFYKHASLHYENYSQELKFLESIDEYNYKKYFLVPHIDNIFKLSKINKNKIKDTLDLREIFKKTRLLLSNNGFVIGFTVNGNQLLDKNIYDIHHNALFFLLNKLETTPVRKIILKDDIDEVDLLEILEKTNMTDDFTSNLLALIVKAKDDQLLAIDYIKKSDDFVKKISF